MKEMVLSSDETMWIIRSTCMLWLSWWVMFYSRSGKYNGWGAWQKGAGVAKWVWRSRRAYRKGMECGLERKTLNWKPCKSAEPCSVEMEPRMWLCLGVAYPFVVQESSGAVNICRKGRWKKEVLGRSSWEFWSIFFFIWYVLPFRKRSWELTVPDLFKPRFPLILLNFT